MSRRDFLERVAIVANHGARFSTSGAVTLGPATRALAQRTVAFDATAQTLTVS